MAIETLEQQSVVKVVAPGGNHDMAIRWDFPLTFWQAHFSNEKEKATILASASHTVAERRGIGGYVEASIKLESFLRVPCLPRLEARRCRDLRRTALADAL